jgi:hypothetical protein
LLDPRDTALRLEPHKLLCEDFKIVPHYPLTSGYCSISMILCEHNLEPEVANWVKGRIPLHDERMPFSLAWTPKAGCTSLTKWFLFQVGELDAALEYDPWIHRYRREVFQARKRYRAEWLDILSKRDKPVFKLVRNPYDRAMSSCFHVVVALTRRNKHPLSRLAAVAAAMLAEAGIEGKFSFRQYLTALETYRRKQSRIDAHIDQQYRPSEESVVSRIFRLEEFEAEIRELEEKYALKHSPVELLVQSRHHRRQNSALPGSLPDALLDGPMVHAATPSYEAFYDEGTRALVQAIFADDFLHYGYPLSS